jgi:hypothetical protein
MNVVALLAIALATPGLDEPPTTVFTGTTAEGVEVGRRRRGGSRRTPT